MIQKLSHNKTSNISLKKISNRYGVDITEGFKDPNKWLFLTAEKHTSGNRRRMANKLLEDFRNQFLGDICLEIPFTL